MIDFIKSTPITIGISFLALIAFAFPSLVGILDYQTHSSLIEQPLQAIGCHLLHWSGQHLFWDLAMFAVLGAICERLSQRTFLCILAASAILIPPLVGICYPAVETYRGLSGIDTALFGMAAVSIGLQRLQERDRSGALIYLGLLAGMVVKIGHELISGSTFFVESSNFAPVPMAHVLGAALGIIAGIWSGYGRLENRTLKKIRFNQWRLANNRNPKRR